MRQRMKLRWRWLVSAAAATLLFASAGVALTGAATANVGTLAATAGCGTAPTLTNGTHTIFSGGQNRSFILRLPNNYDQNHPHRLIFGFHWLNGSALMSPTATGCSPSTGCKRWPVTARSS